MNGRVSRDIWIYFVVMIPLTASIAVAWWMHDRSSNPRFGEDELGDEKRMKKIEEQTLRKIKARRRTPRL